MKRVEYMKELSEALEAFGEDVRTEIMEDYEEHYEIGLQEGKTEEQISDELGDIAELVKELKKSEIIEQKQNDQDTAKQESADDSWVKQSKESSYNQNDPSLPRKVEVHSKFAHVEVITSEDNQIHLDWVNYQSSRAKENYEFRSWMNGNTIYGELNRTNIGGIFSVMFAGDVKIVVRIPKGFPEVEIISMSGDTFLHDVETQSVKVNAASGDIQVERCNTNQMSLDTKSGDILCKQSRCSNLYMDTKSGDITFFHIQSNSIHARSLSGDVRGNNITGDANVSTASGDIQFAAAEGNQYDLASISGEIEVQRTQAESIRMDSKSGEIKAEMCVANCVASTISGDLDLVNAREASVQASSVSGDIDLRCSRVKGYTADLHTISGKASMSFNGRTDKNCGNGVFTYGEGTTRIKAKTTSGDIKISD